MQLGKANSKAFFDSFNKLLEGNIVNIPAKVSMKLKKIDKKLKEEFKNIEEIHKQLSKDLAEKDESGNAIIIENNYILSDENKAIIVNKLNELMQVEVDLGEKIPFASIEKVNLSVKDLINLDDVIDDVIE
jgi:molybdopterin converting factor small subunit